MNFIKTALTASAFLFSANAYSAIISTDWQSAGDNLITRDTVSGLEWLDLTETLGLSYNYVNGQLGAGGLYEGMRYATYEEVSDFIIQFGLPDNYYYEGNTPPVDYIPAITNIVNYMGETYTDSSFGIDAYYGQPSNGNVTFLSMVSFNSGFHRYITDDINHGSNQRPQSGSYSHIGHFLVTQTEVSPVPVPAAAWLFGSGLLGLIGVARRKKVA